MCELITHCEIIAHYTLTTVHVLYSFQKNVSRIVLSFLSAAITTNHRHSCTREAGPIPTIPNPTVPIPTGAIPTLCHGWCRVSVHCAHINDITHPNPSFGGMVPLRMSSILSAVALLDVACNTLHSPVGL